jgi:hypothetical protein
VIVFTGDYVVEDIAWVAVVVNDEYQGWLESRLVGPAPDPTTDSCTPTSDVAPDDWPGGVQESASLRTAPGSDCPVIRTLQEGEEVAVQTVPYEVDGVSWVKVETGDGEVGWVVWTVLNDIGGPD